MNTIGKNLKPPFSHHVSHK